MILRKSKSFEMMSMKFWVLLLFLMVQSGLSEMVAKCPPDYVRRGGTSECYLFHYWSTRTWHDAKTYCERENGNLVMIGTPDMTGWLAQQIAGTGQTGNYWIDARYNSNEKLWYWDATGGLVDMNILPQDKEKNGDYGTLTKNSTLRGQSQSSDYPFICHKSIDTPMFCDFEEGWHMANDRCYSSPSTSTSWTNAVIKCAQINGYIVTINGDQENMYAYDDAARHNDNLWIGLTELTHPPGMYNWTGPSSSYSNWNDNMSMPLTQDGIGAAVIDVEDLSGRWVTEFSTNEHHFLCESDKGACVIGWELFQDSCYYFNSLGSDEVTWNTAYEMCNNISTHLAIVDSPEEDDFIRDHLEEQYQMWIGLYTNVSEGEFQWVDGTGYSSDNFTQMTEEDEQAALDTEKKRCVYTHVLDGGTADEITNWIPVDCADINKYVCEVPKGTPVNMHVPPNDQFCPEDWKLANDHCYYHSEEEYSWTTAENNCRHTGGHLTSINSWTEQDSVREQITSNSWIGLNDQREDTHFRWSDGSSVVIQNWNPGEPSGGNENCVEMQKEGGRWNDLPCTDLLTFICKQPYSTTPFVPPTTTTEAPESQACGHDWTEDPSTGICYRIIEIRLASHDASLYCKEISYSEGQSRPDLVSFSFIQEQLFVQDLIGAAQLEDTAVHIGLINDLNEGKLYWRDYDPVTYLNWGEGEPNGAFSEDVVEMLNDGLYRWNDIESNKRQAFVCEKKGLNYVAPTAPPAVDDTCPSGWTSFNQHCYYISDVNDRVEWETGKSRCSEMYDSTYISIMSADENTFLLDGITGGGVNVWIGLYADGPNVTFVEWQDGSPLEYTNWYIGEPNNQDGNELCAEMMESYYGIDGQGEWNDMPCYYASRFACKMTFKTCPQSWGFWNDKCYYISDNMQTFNISLNKCKEVEGEASLLSWHSQEEEDYVLSIIDDSIPLTWLGLYHMSINESWVWTDGTDTDFVNWRPGQPDKNDTEFCAPAVTQESVGPVGDMDNYPCSASLNYACGFIPTHSMGCDDGWSIYKGFCYYCNGNEDISEQKSFDQSRQRCQDMGGDLTSIMSEEENQFIASMIPEYAFFDIFIGLRSVATGGQMEWSDGSQVIYTNLAAMTNYGFETECYGMTYYSYYETFSWDALDCGEASYFSCKKPQTAIPIGPPTSGCLTNDDLAHEGSCYRMVKSVGNFDNASKSCKEVTTGSHLVTIKNQLENAFLSAYYGDLGEKVWIGLKEQSNPDGSMQYKWIDGTGFSFDSWGQYEPRSSEGACVYATGESGISGLWYVTNCDNTYPYICEYERPGYTSDAPPVTTPRPSNCAPGWTHNTATETCYKLMSTGGLTEGLAQQDCMQYGGNLVSIGDENEERFIKELPDMINMTYTTLWTGLILGEDAEPSWTDGTPVNFLHWAEGQPDSHNGRENCGSANKKNLQLSDTYCDGIFAYMCEAPQGMSPITPPPVTITPDVACPGSPGEDGWLLFADHCYRVYSQTEVDPQGWKYARQFCQDKGAELVSILNQEENSFVLSKVASHSDSLMWIGAYATHDRPYSWSDGEPWDFVNWDIGQPDNQMDQEACVCVKVKSLAYWHDYNCGSLFGWVCKMPSGSTRPPPPPTETPVGHCNQGWTHAGSRCVKLYSEYLTFDGARPICREAGVNSDLVSIHGPEMQAVITAMINPLETTPWIGFRKGSTFVWLDQSPVDYTNWAIGEPNNNAENEECVEMFYHDGSWNDVSCSLNRTFVCMENIDPNLSTHNPPLLCNSPYDLYVNYSGSCYKAVNDPKTWQEAEDYCIAEGAHLASVESIAENSYIYVSTVDSFMENAWLGLNSLNNPDQYLWSDGFPVLYTNWDENEPNTTDTSSRCVSTSVADAGRWFNIKCDMKKGFFCKHSEESMPTPDPPVDGTCPSSTWLDFGGGYCYLLVTNVMKSWSESNLACAQEGGDLASIHSPEEMNLIVQATSIYPNNLWIGFIQLDDDFGWSDGSATNYLSWAENEPTSIDEPCVEMYPGDRMWNDVTCGAKSGFICKAPKVGGGAVDPPTDPPPPITTTKSPGGNGSGGLNGGAVAGIVISCLVLASIMGLVGYTYRDRMTPYITALPARLQAARLARTSNDYEDLDHKIGEKDDPSSSTSDDVASPTPDEATSSTPDTSKMVDIEGFKNADSIA